MKTPVFTIRTNHTTDIIISVLKSTLLNNFSVINYSGYKQIHGCAMGSPVNPVSLAATNLCMEIIAAFKTSTKIWKRYVDDSFVLNKKHSVSTFHDTLNSIDPKISFTSETEKEWHISFLDTLVTRKILFSLLMFTESLLIPTETWILIHTMRRDPTQIRTDSALLNRPQNLPRIFGKVKRVEWGQNRWNRMATLSQLFQLSWRRNLLLKLPHP